MLPLSPLRGINAAELPHKVNAVLADGHDVSACVQTQTALREPGPSTEYDNELIIILQVSERAIGWQRPSEYQDLRSGLRRASRVRFGQPGCCSVHREGRLRS